MARIELTLAEWQSVAHELAAAHTSDAPAGLGERIQALLTQAPRGWSEQVYALELDETSIAAVRSLNAALTQRDPYARQRGSAVAEAMRIIHDHQPHA
jgi:hypothetical protein